jgi:NLI interacting factor-like phosphatase
LPKFDILGDSNTEINIRSLTLFHRWCKRYYYIYICWITSVQEVYRETLLLNLEIEFIVCLCQSQAISAIWLSIFIKMYYIYKELVKKTVVFDFDDTLVHCREGLLRSPDKKIKINIKGQSIQLPIYLRPKAYQLMSTLS